MHIECNLACSSYGMFNCCRWFTADDVNQRWAEDTAVFRQHTAISVAQNSSDVANSGLLAENAAGLMLDHQWQRQLLMQLRSELPAVDSRIAHLRILMDLARSVCQKLILLDYSEVGKLGPNSQTIL